MRKYLPGRDDKTTWHIKIVIKNICIPTKLKIPRKVDIVQYISSAVMELKELKNKTESDQTGGLPNNSISGNRYVHIIFIRTPV